MRLIPPTLVLLIATSTAPACPTCRDSTTVGRAASAADAQVTTTAGYNSGIYLTLGGFFAVLGFVGYGIAKGVRSAAKQEDG